MYTSEEKLRRKYTSIIANLPRTKEAVSKKIKTLRQKIKFHAALHALANALIGALIIAAAVYLINSAYTFGMLAGTLTGIFGTIIVIISYPIYLSAKTREDERLAPFIQILTSLLKSLEAEK